MITSCLFYPSEYLKFRLLGLFLLATVFSLVKCVGMKDHLPWGVCDLEKTGNDILGSTAAVIYIFS